MQSPNFNHFTTTDRGSARGFRLRVGLLAGLVLFGSVASEVPAQLQAAVKGEVVSEATLTLSDLAKQMGCGGSNSGNFDDWVRLLAECLLEHGVPEEPAAREGVKRDTERLIGDMDEIVPSVSPQTAALLQNLLTDIVAELAS